MAVKNEPEYFLNVLLGVMDNTEDNRLRLHIDRLFTNSRDEYRVNDIVLRTVGDREALYTQIRRLMDGAQTERERRHAVELVEKLLYIILLMDGTKIAIADLLEIECELFGTLMPEDQ